MQRYSDNFIDSNGRPVKGAAVLVRTYPGNVPATLYSDNGVTTTPNPLTTDALGLFSFYAADGRYSLTITSDKTEPVTRVDVQLEDPTDTPAVAKAELAADTGAALVGFKSAGTGAVMRSIQDKLREVVSVKDFGAVGDGVMDDTSAIQAALDHVKGLAFGGKLFIPAGRYRLTAPLNAVSSKYLHVYGVGKGTQLFGATGFGALIEAGATANAAHGCVFEEFMLCGPVTGATNGIALDVANVFQIKNIWFESQNIGITMASSYAVEMTGLVFDVTASEAIRATTSAHNAVISGCNFFTCGVASSKPAISFAVASNNIVVDDNDFENCYRVATLQDCTSITLKGNYIEYSDVSDVEFLGTCQGVEMNGNWIALGTQPLTIANVTGMDLRYNTIYNHTINIGTGVSQLRLGHNPVLGTGAVNINHLRFESRASGGGIPSLRPAGPDTDIQARISSKGAADVSIYTNNESNLTTVFGHVASAVNWARHVPSASGQPLDVIAQGSSADIDYRITPKGAGRLRFGSLTATADAPVVGYIEVKDANGTLRKLAVIA